MTISILTMRPLAETLTPRTAVEMSQEKTAASAADAEARRLAAAIGNGNETAFDQLYERYHRRLLRLALVLGHGDECLAHETVQGTFIVAAKKLRSVDGEEHLWNWLAQVARQQISRACRQRKRDAAVMDLDGLSEQVVTAECDRRLEEILDAALAGMDPDERQIIEQFYFDRISCKEIAERLSLTPKAVSSRLERARARLRLSIAEKLSHET